MGICDIVHLLHFRHYYSHPLKSIVSRSLTLILSTLFACSIKNIPWQKKKFAEKECKIKTIEFITYQSVCYLSNLFQYKTAFQCRARQRGRRQDAKEFGQPVRHRPRLQMQPNDGRHFRQSVERHRHRKRRGQRLCPADGRAMHGGDVHGRDARPSNVVLQAHHSRRNDSRMQSSAAVSRQRKTSEFRSRFQF